MSLVQNFLRGQHSVFRAYLTRLASRADSRLRRGEDDPSHTLAKTVAAAATLVELDEKDGIVNDLLIQPEQPPAGDTEPLQHGDGK